MRRDFDQAEEYPPLEFYPVTELQRLPSALANKLYDDAFNSTYRGWRLWAIVTFQVLNAVFVIALGRWLYHSRFNPGLPEAVFFFSVLLCLGLPIGLLPLWLARRRMQRYVWARIDYLCSACGYDLTGNSSGVCPECGREIAADKADHQQPLSGQ